MARVSLLFGALCVISIFLSLRYMLNANLGERMGPHNRAHLFEYDIVPDIFSPSIPATQPDTYDYLRSDLGLIKKEYETDPTKDGTIDAKEIKTQWARLQRYVEHLNTASPRKVQHKVLILGRHGEGWHN